MPSEPKEKPTHIIQFLLDFDASKIFSPDKVEGMKYILGAKNAEELMGKYVSFIMEKVANTISDQKDLNIARVSWSSFDNFIKQEQMQQRSDNQLAQPNKADEKIDYKNADDRPANEHTSKSNIRITEEEVALINHILRVQFEKESAAEQVDAVVIDSSLQDDRFITALKERVGLPIEFEKLEGRKFKLITNSKGETINGR